MQKAEIIREKGTNRSQFFRGEVDKYTWQDIGSSYLPGELIAAFLWAQLEEAQSITNERMRLWNIYHELLEPLEKSHLIRRPIIPEHTQHNGHLYYVILNNKVDRQFIIESMKKDGVGAVSHYVPLHNSPAGQKYSRTAGKLILTETLSEQVLRLPLWIGFQEMEIVISSLKKAIMSYSRTQTKTVSTSTLEF